MFTRLSTSGHFSAGDDLDREFDTVYARIIASRGVRTDEEELAVLNELVRRAEQGSYPENGTLHIISPRADIDWASDDAMRAVSSPAVRNNGMLAGGALIAGALLFALFSLISRHGSDGGSSGSASATSATAVTAATTTALAASSMTDTDSTLSIAATQTAIAQATSVWAGSGVVVGTDYKQKLPPLYPETLEIDGVPFRVYPSSMEGGRWKYQQVEGTASWIGGTVINWSFGLPAIDSNTALFKRLGEVGGVKESTPSTESMDGTNGSGGVQEKEVLLRMSGGVMRRFRLQPPVQIERQQIEVFMQNRPGLTIVLLGDEQGKQRWLLRGLEDYDTGGYGAQDLPDPSEVSPVPTTSPVPTNSAMPRR